MDNSLSHLPTHLIHFRLAPHKTDEHQHQQTLEEKKRTSPKARVEIGNHASQIAANWVLIDS